MGRGERIGLSILLALAAVLIFWATTIFLVGIGFIPEHGHVCDKPDTRGEKACTRYYIGILPFVYVANFLNEYNGLIVAVFTALLWWVSRGQHRILRKSVSIAADNVDSLHRIERAYVFVKVEAAGSHTQTLLGTHGVRVVFANRGKTPATLTGFRGALIASDSPLTAFPHDFSRDFPRAWAVATEDDFLYPLTVPSSIESHDVLSGSKTLYCCGVVFYEDIFKNKRETGFCWEYIAKDNRFKPADQHELNYQT